MDLSKPFKGFGSSGAITVIAFCAFWSSNSFAAATAEFECDKLARGLKRLDTPVGTIHASPVDHTSTEAEKGIEQTELSSDNTETTTPLLYLTPRVASLLREVFAIGGNTDADENVLGMQSSPVAETEEVEYGKKPIDVDPSALDDVATESDLPLFQRQMYRTDI